MMNNGGLCKKGGPGSSLCMPFIGPNLQRQGIAIAWSPKGVEHARVEFLKRSEREHEHETRTKEGRQKGRAKTGGCASGVLASGHWPRLWSYFVLDDDDDDDDDDDAAAAARGMLAWI